MAVIVKCRDYKENAELCDVVVMNGDCMIGAGTVVSESSWRKIKADAKASNNTDCLVECPLTGNNVVISRNKPKDGFVSIW